MPKITVEELTNSAMQDPLFMLEYFNRHRGTAHPVPALKLLFNRAGKAVPKGLQEATALTYEISRKDIAGLIYRTARNNGESIPSAASRWLKMRVG